MPRLISPIKNGARFRMASNTQAFLHLYACDGWAMLHRLRGMFEDSAVSF
jgi:hypothetical protein